MSAFRGGPVRAGVMIGCVVALGLALAACEGLKDTLGWNKQSPDEFVVVTRAPLTLPPDFTLRPPMPGAHRPQRKTVQEQAKASLYGAKPQAPVTVAAPSKGEQALLERANAAKVRPGVRLILEEEKALEAQANEALVDTLVFWRATQAPGAVRDTSKATQRPAPARAEGKSPDSGETAVIERREKTIFDIIF